MKKIIAIFFLCMFLCQGCAQENQSTVSKISIEEKFTAKVTTTNVSLNKRNEQYLGNLCYDDIYSMFLLRMKENNKLCLVQKEFVSEKECEEHEIELCPSLKKYFNNATYQIYLTNYMCDTEDTIYAYLRTYFKGDNKEEAQDTNTYGIVEINPKSNSMTVLWEKKAGSDDNDLNHITNVYLLDNGDFVFYNFADKLLIEYSRLGKHIQKYPLERFQGNYIGIANDQIWTYDEEENTFFSYALEDNEMKYRVHLESSIENETKHVPIIYYNDKSIYYIMFGKIILKIKDNTVELVRTNMELPSKYIAPYAKEIYNTIFFPEYKESDLSEFNIYKVNISEENKSN